MRERYLQVPLKPLKSPSHSILLPRSDTTALVSDVWSWISEVQLKFKTFNCRAQPPNPHFEGAQRSAESRVPRVPLFQLFPQLPPPRLLPSPAGRLAEALPAQHNRIFRPRHPQWAAQRPATVSGVAGDPRVWDVSMRQGDGEGSFVSWSAAWNWTCCCEGQGFSMLSLGRPNLCRTGLDT